MLPQLIVESFEQKYEQWSWAVVAGFSDAAMVGCWLHTLGNLRTYIKNLKKA